MQNTLHPQVDLIVLNYNGKKFLDDCFQSLRLTNYPNFKLHLLDNGSTEDDIAYVQAHYPEVNIIFNPLNNGFCAAYNLSFSVCTGKYLVCLNNDIKVKADWLEHLVRAAEADTQIAALQPKMVSFFDKTQFEYAGSSGGMIDIYGYPFLRGRVFDTIESDYGQYNDEANVFWTCGAAMFIRASVLKEIGNLEESIVHHMDEIDLNWRMHMGGYTCKVIPSAVIMHYGGATIQQQSFKKMYWNHRNSIYIMMKNYGTRNAIIRTAQHFLLDYLTMAQAITKADFTRIRAIASAHTWILKNIGLILRKRKEVQGKRKLNDAQIEHVFYPKSAALQYFLWGKKTYTDLTKTT